MDIQALNYEWFYDDVTPRGVSFDGFLPQACKTPLGNIGDFELIQTPAKMAEFQNNYWCKKNPGLGEILLTVAPLKAESHRLFDEYRAEVERFLSCPCDLGSCGHDTSSGRHPDRGACRGLDTLRKDVSRYGENMSGSLQMNDGKLYDVKKEVYRLTDRVLAGLAKCFHIDANGAFDILGELCNRGIIQSAARDNLASAVGISLKLRLSTYLHAGKQEEEMKSIIAKSDGGTSPTSDGICAYHMPEEKELFHFFYVTIPLYEELHRFCDEDRSLSGTLSREMVFFDHSDTIKGQAFARALNYVEALQSYDRALAADPGNIDLQIRRIRVQLITEDSEELRPSVKRQLDALLRVVGKHYSLPDGIVEQGSLQDDVAKSDHVADLVESAENPIDDDQIFEILYLSSSFFRLQGDFEKARVILGPCLEIADRLRLHNLQLLIQLDILQSPSMSGAPIEEEHFQTIISQLSALICDEGLSVQGIAWLNKLGEILALQGNYDEAYHCFQRALTMGRAVFGINMNFNVVETLLWLGKVSMCLSKYDESKYYLEKLLNLVQASNAGKAPLIFMKETYRLLSTIFAYTNHPTKAISYLEKGLATMTSSTRGDLILDCTMHCTMAFCWYSLDASKKARLSASNAKECLRKIDDERSRATLSCIVAKTYSEVGQHEEALNLAKMHLEDLHPQSDAVAKVEHLSFLGELCMQQGLVTDGEQYYEKALEIQRSTKDNMSDFVQNLLAVANILLDNGKSPEATSYVNEAWKYTSAETNRDTKCKFLRRIAECWKKLENIHAARKCLEEALEICTATVVPSKVPLVEIDVLVKLADLAGDFASNNALGRFASPEQVKKAKRIHYDRAGEVLRRHMASGNVDSTTIVLLRKLASKYHSIDSSEQEQLLLEALEISHEVYGSGHVNEAIAGILIGLSDLYCDNEDYATAAEFLNRSLNMEIEMHLSEPYHSHISHVLSSLSVLYPVFPGSKQLEDTLQRVIDFIEREIEGNGLTNSAAKANCFVCIAYLLLYSGDFERAESYNEMASEIFATVSKAPFPKGTFLDTKRCELLKRLLGLLNTTPENATMFQTMFASGLLVPLFQAATNTEVPSSSTLEATGTGNLLLNTGGTYLCMPSQVETEETSPAAVRHHFDTLPSSQFTTAEIDANQSTPNEPMFVRGSNEQSTTTTESCIAPKDELNGGLLDLSPDRNMSCEGGKLPSSSAGSENPPEEKTRGVDAEIFHTWTVKPASTSETIMQASRFPVPLKEEANDGKDEQKNISERQREGKEASENGFPCHDETRIARDKEEAVSGNNERDERASKATTAVFENDAKDSLKSKMNDLNLIKDSIEYDLRKGNLEMATESIQDCLQPLMMSLIGQTTSDPVELFLSDALKARHSDNFLSMGTNIYLASRYPSSPRTKAKLSKLSGQCHVHNQNYKMAAVSFGEAVAFYQSLPGTAARPELDVLLEHTECLIGLTRSHLLCNEVQDAWDACLQGMALVSAAEAGVTTSGLSAELSYLAAKCTIKLRAHWTAAREQDLERAVSFCLEALSACDTVDGVLGSNDLTEELGGYERGEYFSLKCEIKLLLGTTLSALQKPEDARNIVMEMFEFLENVVVVFETFSKTTWTGGEANFFKTQRRLYSWIGRALMLSGETEAAASPLTRSLAACLTPISTTSIPPQEEMLALLDAITACHSSAAQREPWTQFRQTLELCKLQFIEQNIDLKELRFFLGSLGNHYLDCGRTEEAVVVFETGLEVAKYSVDDAQESRKQMLVYLAGAHLLQAIKNGGKGTEDERRLAERYYRNERNSRATTKDDILDIMHANVLLQEKRFKEVIRLLEQIPAIGEKVWHACVLIPYSKRLLHSPDVQRYIKSHGQLSTSTGSLVYSMLVHAYVAMGMKTEAVDAYEKLSTNGRELKSAFEERYPWLPYLLGSCQKSLLSLVEDKSDLCVDDSDVPLAEQELAKVYYKLAEYELSLQCCLKVRMSMKSSPVLPGNERELSDRIQSELLTLRLAGNALVMLGRANDSYPYFSSFLDLLHVQTRILDLPFDKANGILAEYSFADAYYPCRALGTVLVGQGKIDRAMECYEHCLRLDQDCNHDQSLVATLAELYQSKAALAEGGGNTSACEKWMKKALGCFEELLGKDMELVPFVEASFASLLLRTERIQEAVFRFEHVLSVSDDTMISFTDADKPLVSAHLRREIEARNSVVLPLKVHVYSELALTYLKLGEVDKAQDGARRMEEYATRFVPNPPNFPLILSILGYTHKELGNRSRAAEIFNEVLKMEPGHLPVNVALASCATCDEKAQ